MRTIDADALLELWCSEVCKAKPRCDEDCMFYDYLTIDSLSPTIEPEPHWIPIKWHYITDEEREESGYPKDWVYYLDCEMPEDGQEILVTTKHGYVEKDVCYLDDGYSLDSGWDWIEDIYSLDSGWDWIEDIVAWMPLPKPYKEDGTEGR